MVTCQACGTEFPEDRRICPQCGEVCDYPYGKNNSYSQSDNYRRPKDMGGYSSSDPAYVYSTPKDRLPMSTGGFLISLFLMNLPLVGFIIQLVWALGGVANVNRRHLARAVLILNIIVIALLVIVGIAISSELKAFYDSVKTFF